ncbi:torsin-2A-like [Ischnura elegans]|uniref:torsin-2A-like n=1 Tax=Ischnura elegans TaxID=197161 RepID=UPI001ED86FC9|nr:torsin-2A-like [Ischnura elegans]
MSLDFSWNNFTKILFFSLVFFHESCSAGFLDTIRSVTRSILERGKEFTCNHVSCCESHLKPTEWSWMWYKDSPLYESLQSKLFGQHLVQDAIVHGVTLHKTKPRSDLLLLRIIRDIEDEIQEEVPHNYCGIWDDPGIKYEQVILREYKKRLNSFGGALVIFMFGPMGTGKSYASSIIADSLYKKGLNSPLVHQFTAKSFISLERDNKPEVELLNWIKGNISSCPYSLFIFDEFNELPIEVIREAMKATISTEFRDAIFIFIMTIEGIDSMQKIVELYGLGQGREDIKLEEVYEPDFRELFSYLEKKYDLEKCIDEENFMNGRPKNAVFAPFLPLESPHVRNCIVDHYFHSIGVSPSDDMIRSVENHVMYGPEGNEKFALHGCKQIHSLVTSAISRERRFSRDKEL